MGQDLFYPPNVGGWPGGRAGSSRGLSSARANFAAALVGGTTCLVASTPFNGGVTRRCSRAGRVTGTEPSGFLERSLARSEITITEQAARRRTPATLIASPRLNRSD